MRRSAGSTIDPGVFWVSLGIYMLFVVWGVCMAEAPQQSSSLEREAGG